MSINFENISEAIAKPSKLAHIVLRTCQLSSMVTFYKVFLDATVSYENDMMSFLRYDEEHHRIGILALPGTTPKAPTSSGLEHVAFTYNCLSDLLMAYLQRKKSRIMPFWCINHGPTISIYYKDPDGNQIETLVDIFEPMQAQEFMSSKEYNDNPIGVEFDPDSFIQELKAGGDQNKLMVRPNIGPRPPPSFN